MTKIEMMKPLNHCGTKRIETERLVLRQFELSDCYDMYKWTSNIAVVKYLSYYPHKNVEETKQILKCWINGYQNLNEYNWAIEYNGCVIGNISVVSRDDECYSCHLGWQIDEPYWNKGIMTEAAKAVLDYLFGEVGYDRITSGHDTRNVGSGRVMQKIGMTLEGTFRRYIYQKDGSIGDKNYYAILKSEWEKLRNYTLKNPIRQISIDEYHKCGNIWNMEKCPYTDDFKRQITEGDRLVFIYKNGDEFIGEVDLVTKNDDPDYTIEGRRVYLSRLIVKKEYRNNGIGAALTKFLINKAKRMGYDEISLGVNTDNEPAIHLYKKFGFEIIKTDSDENGEFYKMLCRMRDY